MRIQSIFQRRALWSVALFRLREKGSIFEINKHEPFLILGETGLRRSSAYHAITADPFLITHKNKLYLFYEIKTDFEVGEIWAQSMDEQGTWTNHGRVLKESFHLSYPQVFYCDGKVYMIPETAQSGEVRLYVASSFPCGWTKLRTLIGDPLVDTSIIIREDGIYLLGTTRAFELKLYFAPAIDQEFVQVGGVISDDKSIARNGGSPLDINGCLYRVAQNCSIEYGKSISLLRIDRLDSGGYSEKSVKSDLYQTKPKWMREGYHHMTVATFNGECYVALDGQRKDRYLNTMLLALFKVTR